MQGIIREIISKKTVYERIQAEIDTVATALGSKSIDQVPNMTIKKMSYLQACISEGLRMYPAITQLRERVVPPQGDNLHGYFIPGGTFVALNGLCSKYDPIYGKSLDEYRPERWLVEDPMLIAQMQRNLELNFGHGSSKCLGINLARMEINKVIFEV